MDKGTQLPAEADKTELQAKALVYSLKGHSIFSHPHPGKMFYPGTGQAESYTHYLNGMNDCATEYAIKLNQLREHYEVLKISYDAALDKAVKSRALLNKFIYRHEAGLLPDMFIYNEIKTFLDGK